MPSLIGRAAALALLACAVFSGITAAQEPAFRRVQLSHGISLEIPSHWTVLSSETRKNLSAVGQAIAENSGTELPAGRKEPLLAVNAVPSPTGATIRVSVTSPPDYTQADLAATKTAELKDLESEMLRTFRKMEAAGGPKIIQAQPFRIERFNNQLTLVMPYVRAGINGPSPWQVVQYKIPRPTYLLELTLSHRQSDAALWAPILERVKRSIQF
ncbi:MAG TPA: hypothetical protein VHP37_20535 [Burkholderiales bacterium]|nr:hypothetical protein [Burkholderiales bacterium]